MLLIQCVWDVLNILDTAWPLIFTKHR